ncbi:MAG TPA: hypothetical protein VNS46_05740 [Nocardioides sp.]|nr:hypothetical protein [Nocardioides sp.]
MGIRMMRTWLARGTAVVVTTFVVGAWALGLALGKDAPPQDRETVPAAPETSVTPTEEPSVMGTREDRPRTPDATPSAVVPVAETADLDDDPTTDESSADDPRTPKPTPKPSSTPKPRPSDRPTTTPSPTPTEADCKELSEVVDCVLAPITTRP